jgi:hypothetical protein
MNEKSVKVNGKKLKINDITLEDVVLDRNVMVKFILWLNKQYCSENILFWLETQNFKYLTNDDDILGEVKRIYERYFEDSSLNLDEPIIIEQLKERMKLPDRTLFMLTQNAIWALLKYECFPKFKVDYGKSLVSKLTPKTLKQIVKLEPEAVELYDQFLSLTVKNVDVIDEFKPTTLPNDEYDEHERQNLPSINEIWLDRDLMLAFREFLYQQMANDNLSFYLATINYEYLVPEEELEKAANDIFEKFIITDAPNMVPLDFDLVSKIQKNLKKAPNNNQLFHVAQESIFQTLESQWFPEFLASPLYKACNDETIEFNKSDGGKERSNTMQNYDTYVALLRKKNRVKKKTTKKRTDSKDRTTKKKKDDKSY